MVLEVAGSIPVARPILHHLKFICFVPGALVKKTIIALIYASRGGVDRG